MAIVQISAGAYGDAVENFQRILEESRTFPAAKLLYARALLFNGQKAEALDRLEEHALAMKAAAGQGEGVKALIYAITGRRAEAEEIAARFAFLPPRQVEIYGLLGDNDRVLEALERLAIVNPGRAGWSSISPSWRHYAVIRESTRSGGN